VGLDTLLILQRNASGNRTSRATASLEPGRMARSLIGAGTGPEAQGVPSVVLLLDAVDPIFIARQGGLSSRFFREPVNPGAAFQLGWGSRNDLRFLDGDTASIFTGQTSWTGGTGVRLPLNLRISGNYSESRAQILHSRSEREIWTRAWPDLRVTLTQVDLPDFVAGILESLSLSSGFRKNLMETTYGGRGLQRRFNEEWQVPFEVNAIWVGAVTTRYRGSLSTGDGRDPTGDTQTRRQAHSVLFSSSLSDPPLLGDRLDGPLRLTLGYQHSSDLNCRVPQGRTGCVAFVDLLNRSLNLTLDTVLTPMEVGLHLTYTDRKSFVGQHDGSSQFQLGIFGQFLFNSGTFASPASAPPSGGF
jgi:hypothetical protein